MNFLYDDFNEFLNNKEGISYLNDYSNKSEDINNTWIEISNKYVNDELISKNLWDKLFNFDIYKTHKK